MAGFCSFETTQDEARGVFHWNETEVDMSASTTCTYGPPGVRVTRLCASRGVLEAPSLQKCRTVVSNRFKNISQVRKKKNGNQIDRQMTYLPIATDEHHH